MEGLEVKNLSKRIGDFTLEASFSVGRGERAAIVGPSGSGKTSLLRLIAGLERADAGEIRLGGAEISQLAPERREIGVVFQEQALFPAMSVLENAAFGLRMRGISKPEREVQARKWLERVDLGTRADSDVRVLSGGERQRVAFVRAIVWKPKLLLLDEPFSALDRSLRDTLRREIVALHALWPVPLLLVTHDEVDVSAVATRRIACVSSASGTLRRFSPAEN